MLIGKVIDRARVEYTWEIVSDKLADLVRNIWLDNRNSGVNEWEQAFGEEPVNIEYMRKEGVRDLVNIQYIFKWWGNADSDGLAGQLDVIWTFDNENTGKCDYYATWIKFADRDFIIGIAGDEAEKREVTRKEIRSAFATWLELFDKQYKEKHGR